VQQKTNAHFYATTHRTAVFLSHFLYPRFPAAGVFFVFESMIFLKEKTKNTPPAANTQNKNLCQKSSSQPAFT
jgi:hypothetical protein